LTGSVREEGTLAIGGSGGEFNDSGAYKPVMTQNGLKIDLWTDRARCRETVEFFYAGEIRA